MILKKIPLTVTELLIKKNIVTMFSLKAQTLQFYSKLDVSACFCATFQFRENQLSIGVSKNLYD